MATPKKRSWKKYAFEFFSIFIAVVSAFWLNNWNDNRKLKQSEEKILQEIKNGIELDLQDFKGNTFGYKQSLKANAIFRNLVNDITITQDSIGYYYTTLFRDYVPIINLSGYESLKSGGLKIVRNDSLRFEIISLYDFYYSILDKVEYQINEMKSYDNYYKPVNDILHPYMIFNDMGNLMGFEQPLPITKDERKAILSYLWRLETNRLFKLGRYDLIETRMLSLKTHIEEELNKR